MRQGLMQPPAGLQQQPAGAPPAAGDSGDYLLGGEASPQEQAMYDELMGALFGMIHSEQTRGQVVAKLKGATENPGATIGEMALAMFTGVEGQITRDGGEVPDSVKLEVAEDLVAELVQVAVLIGVVPDDEDAIGVTMSAALDVLASSYGNQMRDGGLVEPEQARGNLAGLAQIAQREFARPPGEQTAMAKGVQQAQGGGR